MADNFQISDFIFLSAGKNQSEVSYSNMGCKTHSTQNPRYLILYDICRTAVICKSFSTVSVLMYIVI